MRKLSLTAAKKLGKFKQLEKMTRPDTFHELKSRKNILLFFSQNLAHCLVPDKYFLNTKYMGGFEKYMHTVLKSPLIEVFLLQGLLILSPSHSIEKSFCSSSKISLNERTS